MMVSAHKTESIEGESVIVLVDGGMERSEPSLLWRRPAAQASTRYPEIEAQDCDKDMADIRVQEHLFIP
jgi:hypothetical protein